MALTACTRLAGLLQDICSLPPGLDREFGGMAMDSREVRAGDLFLACRGRSGDGRQHVPEALARGAVAVLLDVDVAAPEAPAPQLIAGVPQIPVPGLQRQAARLAARFHGEPARTLRLVGVTGTNGKTTCTQLIAGLLHAAGRRCGVIGTLGHGLSGEPLQALGSGPGTTPDALRLQQILAGLRQQGTDTVVMEVSSHGLDQCRVEVDDFEVAAFTNLSRDHLDYHHSMEAYAAAKRRLFSGRRLHTAVLNLDDAWSAATRAGLAPGVRCLSWSLHNPAADFCAERIEYLPEGLCLHLRTPWGGFELRSRLLGAFNAANLLTALATAMACETGGDSMTGEARPARAVVEALVAALGELPPVPGRMQLVAAAPVTVVVDYAHTPDGLEQALQALRQHASGRVTCVVGCGGERDRGKRPLMAAVAERLADRVILSSDNPRGEDPAAIIADMLQGVLTPAALQVEPDRARAITQAVLQAADGDCILIAGKGHEQYQEIAGSRHPFDDVMQARQALAQRLSPAGSGGHA